jgi:pimeloyl-ACP methyl ester carboxylesterase
MATRIRNVMKVDVSEALASCSVPILYLQGRRDRLVDKKTFASLAAVRSDIIHKSVDAPHLVLQTEPEASWQHIIDFVERLNCAL